MSMIKPVANQRRSVGMMEIMGSRTGRYAGMAYARTWWCSLGLGHEPVICLVGDGAARLCVAVHQL